MVGGKNRIVHVGIEKGVNAGKIVKNKQVQIKQSVWICFFVLCWNCTAKNISTIFEVSINFFSIALSFHSLFFFLPLFFNCITNDPQPVLLISVHFSSVSVDISMTTFGGPTLSGKSRSHEISVWSCRLRSLTLQPWNMWPLDQLIHLQSKPTTLH